jgi:hypothetical protein
MRLGGYRVALAVLCAMVLVASAAHAAPFVVTTTADSGVGSLRQAITDANAASDADTISFAIVTTGIPQITPATNLPAVTNPVTIDGTTQLLAGRVELTGTTTIGLNLTGTGITVRGFVINGFTSAGVRISGTGGNVVEGNYIGTNTAGMASASPTSSTGVIVATSGGNRIGGWDAAARNLISGSGTGIFFSGNVATPNLVVGNWIGTDATGLAALPNTGHGIESFLGSGNTIGGTTTGAGNVIAGNGTDGIAVSGSDYVIQANLVGIGADGVTAVANGRHGIRLLNTAADGLIGGAAPNYVANNKSAGILLAVNAAQGNAILSNVVHDNGALGIDTNGSGVNANDVGDLDTGANNGQNFPVLDASFAGGTTIDGTLDTNAAVKSFTIELFANPSCDASGHGEGAELVGSLVVATDVLGHAAFTAPLSRTVGASEFVTATATDPDGNTSEFSACAPSPTPSTTTSTSSSTSTSTSSSSTSSTTVTTSSSSTSTSVPTTSSTSTSVPTTSSTSSSTLAPETTTSTSLPPDETTTTTSSSSTTSTTEDPTTTSTSLPAEDTTTTTSSSTTSTTEDATTSSTSTSDPTTSSTSSSTTLPDPTTTSTSLPPEDTTTTTSSSTTSTTADVTTSSTSTTMPDDSTTTTSSSSSTSTTGTAPTSTTSTSTSTTAIVGSTTSTTLAACAGSGCPSSGCGDEVAFAPLRCRLVGLTTTIDHAAELAVMRSHLDRHLGKARLHFDRAEARCGLAKRGPAKRSLRNVRRRLVKIGKMLQPKSVRNAVPPNVADPIAGTAAALGIDVRALAAALACR